MATRTLQKAEITFPSIDVELLKELALKYGWTVKVKEEKNAIDKSLNEIANNQTFTAKNIDDLMNHLLK